MCLSYNSDQEPPIKEILGVGVDPVFDRAIGLLGDTARKKPKPVIDSVMFWRKTKSEAASKATSALHNYLTAHRRTGSQFVDNKVETLRTEEIKADRKSLISIFILCRVLMEIINKTSTDVLGEDLSSKLEEIVFKQLRATDPGIFSSSTIRAANWELFAELLGKMSRTRFLHVGDEFIAELEKYTGVVPREREPNVQLIIHGMRFLNVQLYPMDLLEDCSEFLISISKFFSLSQNGKIKIAYAEVLNQILLPVGGKATAERNYPTWAKAMESLYQTTYELVSKPKYWHHGFPLLVTILCVSPQEFFSSKWASLLESNYSKLKDKTSRTTVMVSTARLVWVFLCQFTESLNNTTKKLDMIWKPILSSTNKKLWSYVDSTFCNSVCYMIRTIGRGYLQYALENIFFQLIFPTPGIDNNTMFTLETVAHDRAIIGIRSYLYILNDLDEGVKPEFPTDQVLDEFPFYPKISPNSSSSVNTQNSLKQFHDEFGKMLGRMVQLCDSQLGYHGLISEEKQTLINLPIKSQMTFHFGSENNTQNQRQIYADFFCVVLEAIPWCVPSNIAFPKLIEMLTRNTVNPDVNIAEISLRVLKALVRVKDPMNIVPVVAMYLFAFDTKIFSTYNASASSHGDFKVLLNLYIDLLQIWIDTIREKAEAKGEGTEDLKLNNLWTIIEEAEGNGLFFICSQDLSIRQAAFRILRLTAEFENVIYGNTNNSLVANEAGSSSNSSRLIHLFETTDPLLVFKSSNPRINLSNPERRRLHKLHSMKKEGLVRLAESDYGVDTALWLKMFPLVMRLCFETYPIPVALCRNIICGKLVQMHEAVLEFSRSQSVSSSSQFHLKHLMRNHPEIVVEQWRIYLIVASTTLTQTDEQKLHVPDNTTSHGRKKSVQKVTIHHQKITSARSVFRMVIPLFGVEHPIIRDAIVTSLSSVNINIYRTLIECLQPAIDGWRGELRSYNRRDPYVKEKLERISTEVTHVLSSTAHYLKEEIIYEDEWIITRLLSFIGELRNFLGREEVQVDPGYQRLRCYFAALLESVYTGIHKSLALKKLFTYKMRVDYFLFIEEWSGNGTNWEIYSKRDKTMRDIVINRNGPRNDDAMILAHLEFEKNALQHTVSSAMAALCYGPVPSHSTSDFNLSAILAWIEAAFSTNRDPEIPRKALKNLLETNPEDILLFKQTIANCYRTYESDTISQSYFIVFAEVILCLEEYPCHVWQLMALGLYKTGDSNLEVRKLAARLLKAIEIKFYGVTSISEFEARLGNNSPAVYKRVMFNLTTRFAKDHPKEAFMIVSELTMFFGQVSDACRRDILAVLLPWVQAIELQVEPSPPASTRFSPSPSTIMALSNLFEITVVFSDKIQNEVEALWVALGNGLYPGNVKVVLDFVIHYSLELRLPEFVEHARKVLVYLSTTPAGVGLVDTLLSFLEPKSMVPRSPDPIDISQAASLYPYVANLSTLLARDNFKDAGFSRGQLAVIMLVDLSTEGPDPLRAHFPLILHVCYVLLDHYLPIVQNQAREMLIRVIHSMGNYSPITDELIENLRKKDQKSAWSYNSLTSDTDGACTPKAMDQTIQDIFALFEESMPDLRQQWANVALSWATTCPVRHIACRSFQIFRCLLFFLDSNMLGDMLARLSNTISDKLPDIQGFAMQILMTLNAITSQLSTQELLNHPQLFWAAVSCSSTISEKEFVEVLSLLSKYIAKVDLNSAETVKILANVFPTKWSGEFNGLQGCVVAGLRSATSYEPTIKFLDQLNMLESNGMVAGSDRLCISVLSNLPRFLHAIEIDDISDEIVAVAEQMALLCDLENRTSFSRIFTSLAKKRFKKKSKKDFLNQTVQSIRNNFFPFYDDKALVFLSGLLFNDTPWIKNEVLDILLEMLPVVELKKPSLNNIGAELIMPLLRLLQTEYAEKALNVLEAGSLISPSERDKIVLKVSLGDKSAREDFEKDAKLFGVPDENGWSIPQPLNTTEECRLNVHAVFYTCPVSSSDEPSIMNEEFQFHRDEFMMPSAIPDAIDNFSLAENDNEGSLSNMWAELDNLDSFFEAMVPNNHNRNVSMADTDASNDLTIDPVDSAPQIYDNKVSMILKRSLNRTPSTASFKTSLADSFGFNVSAQNMERLYPNMYKYNKSTTNNLPNERSSPLNSSQELYYNGDGSSTSLRTDNTSKFISVPEEPEPKSKSKSKKKDSNRDSNSSKSQETAYRDTLDPGSTSDFNYSSMGRSTPDEVKPAGNGSESLFKLENLLRATNIGKNKKKVEKTKSKTSPLKPTPSPYSPGQHQRMGSVTGVSNSSTERYGQRPTQSQYQRNQTPTPEQQGASSPPGTSYINRNSGGRKEHAEMSPRSFQFPPPSSH